MCPKSCNVVFTSNKKRGTKSPLTFAYTFIYIFAYFFRNPGEKIIETPAKKEVVFFLIIYIQGNRRACLALHAILPPTGSTRKGLPTASRKTHFSAIENASVFAEEGGRRNPPHAPPRVSPQKEGLPLAVVPGARGEGRPHGIAPSFGNACAIARVRVAAFSNLMVLL